MCAIRLDGDDIEMICQALEHGADVRIQNTKDGFRIVEDRVTVLTRRKISDRENHDKSQGGT